MPSSSNSHSPYRIYLTCDPVIKTIERKRMVSTHVPSSLYGQARYLTAVKYMLQEKSLARSPSFLLKTQTRNLSIQKKTPSQCRYSSFLSSYNILHFLVFIIPEQFILIGVNDRVSTSPRKIAPLRVPPSTPKQPGDASPRAPNQKR